MIGLTGTDVYINPETGDIEVRIGSKSVLKKRAKPGSSERVLLELTDKCGPFFGDARPIISKYFTINEGLTMASADYWVTDAGTFEWRDDHWVLIPQLEVRP